MFCLKINDYIQQFEAELPVFTESALRTRDQLWHRKLAVGKGSKVPQKRVCQMIMFLIVHHKAMQLEIKAARKCSLIFTTGDARFVCELI